MKEYRATTPFSVFFQEHLAIWWPEQVAKSPTLQSSSASVGLVLGQLVVGTGAWEVAVHVTDDGKSQTG